MHQLRQGTTTAQSDKSLALYPYQREAVSFLEKRNGLAGLWMEMGTGKSIVALKYLQAIQARRILVVCPLSVAGVWEREVKKWHMPFDITLLSSGTIHSRASKAGKPWPLKGSVEMLVVNYESYWRDPLRKALVKFQPDAVVLDEAHRIKGRSTKQTRFAHYLAAQPFVKHRLALTGTPIMNGIEDLFSIYKFIDPTVFGSAWIDFERRYIIKGGYGGYQIIGYRGEEEVKSKVAKTAFQISKAEALDLPERISTVIPVALSDRTRKAYDQMKKSALLELDALDDEGKPVRGLAMARIVLTTLLRLQQLTGGFVPVLFDGDKSQIVDVGDDKLQTAVDLTRDAVASGEKVVIFCRFIHDIVRLKKALPKAGILSGSVKADQRERVLDRLRDGKIRVLLVQIATGALGIDLTAASVSIFYSTGYSLGEFEQARARVHRHGQTKKVIEYHLQAVDSVDEKIFQALNNKQQIARKVVSLDYARGLLR